MRRDPAGHLVSWLRVLTALAALAPGGGSAASGAPGVERAENCGLLFTDNPAGVSGVDAGYSVPCGERVLWLFGDVFLLSPTAPDQPYVGGVSNCGLLAARGAGPAPLRRYSFLTDPATGLARQLFTNGPQEDSHVRLWPAGGWYDPKARRVYVYTMVIRTTGGGPFDFRLEGHGLASADAAAGASMRFDRLHAPSGSTVWWPASAGPVFGAAVVSGGRPDGYLYVVGVRERDGAKHGTLARVPARRIADPDAYEYYAGRPAAPQWSARLDDAAEVDGLADFPSELSVAWNPFLGGYLAVHSVGISDRIRLSLASQPWGPYRAVAEIGAPHKAFSKAFCYAGKEHPELAQQGGRIIYVTYVDSERYWLRLLKVTLRR